MIYILLIQVSNILPSTIEAIKPMKNAVKKINRFPKKQLDGHIELKGIKSITLKNVVVYYENKQLFQPLNLHMKAGEILWIIGQSGCEKQV